MHERWDDGGDNMDEADEDDDDEEDDEEDEEEEEWTCDWSFGDSSFGESCSGFVRARFKSRAFGLFSSSSTCIGLPSLT